VHPTEIVWLALIAEKVYGLVRVVMAVPSTITLETEHPLVPLKVTGKLEPLAIPLVIPFGEIWQFVVDVEISPDVTVQVGGGGGGGNVHVHMASIEWS
jgi:hypothetical protein